MDHVCYTGPVLGIPVRSHSIIQRSLDTRLSPGWWWVVLEGLQRLSTVSGFLLLMERSHSGAARASTVRSAM